MVSLEGKEMSEQEYKELQERNKVRLAEAKKKLGDKYLLHPANTVKKKSDNLGK